MKSLLLMAAALALASCATVEDDLYEKYEAYLGGGSMAPGVVGHLYGSGTAMVWVAEPPLALCYDLFVQKIGVPYAAHLHRGREREIGPEVLALKAPTDGDSRGCADVSRALRAEIDAEPGAFYIDVHTADFPEGALRGQVERQSPDVTPPVF